MTSNPKWDHIPIQHKSPLKAIRENCIACMGGGKPYQLIAECTSNDCALHAFRFGKNPYRKPSTEKQNEARRRNLQNLAPDARNIWASDGQN